MNNNNFSSDLFTSEVDMTDIYNVKRIKDNSLIENANMLNAVSPVISRISDDIRFSYNNFPVAHNKSKISYKCLISSFRSLLNEEIINTIVLQTNKKIKKTKNNNTRSSNMYVDKDEIMIFIGILLFFSVVCPKNYKFIWKKEELEYNEFIASKMRYKRFSFLHSKFNMFSKKDKSNYKIKKKPKIIRKMIKLFTKNFIAEENLALDESICPFKGRTSNKVYCKEKPCKYGIKFYALCDSKSAYLLDVQIVGEAEKITDLVIRMIAPYANEWRILHMDNFYNSLELTRILYSMKVHTNGTMRLNRGISKEIMSLVPKKWNAKIIKVDENIYFYAYYDNKVVKFISTVYGPLILQKITNIWRKDSQLKKKIRVDVEKNIPRSIILYNENKNGVDKMNQFIKYFNLIRKTNKWNQRLSIYMLELILHNSYILWEPIDMNKKSRKFFISSLAKNLLEFDKFNSVTLITQHYCDTRKTSLRCVWCHKQGKRSITNHFCKTCDKSLHPGECYRNFHEKQDFENNE